MTAAHTTPQPAPKPLLKWAGGKRRVLPEIQKYVPAEYSTYVEPFLGGGAVALHLQPARAHLSDINESLINLYSIVQNTPEDLIAELQSGKYVNDKDTYLKIRAYDRDEQWLKDASPVERAARTVYLNRTGFNGLHRMNSKGQFNVPFGSYTNPLICDESNIRAVHATWSETDTLFATTSYVEALQSVEGDNNFIYCDPPYIPLTATSSFTGYATTGFSMEEQMLLRNLARNLDEAGNFVLLSNSDTPATRELYDGFHIESIDVLRSISAGAASRKAVGEVLVLGPHLASHLSL